MQQYEIIRASQQQLSRWSGGVTRELALYPPGSSYADRNFQVRLSSADIDTESSSFTLLPGYTRHLMPLTSSIKLRHNDDPEMQLAELQPYVFDGGVQTTSYGRCTDMNLMLSSGWEGVMLALPTGAACTYHPGQLMWIYCLHPFTLSCPELFSGENLTLSAGDTFQMSSYHQPISMSVESEWSPNRQIAVMASAWQKPKIPHE